MRHLLSPLAALYLSLIVGCSDSPETDSDTVSGSSQGAPLALPDVLYGTWSSECESEGSASPYERVEWEFSSTTIVTRSLNYGSADSDCITPVASAIFTYEATYRSESQSTQLGDAILTDMIVTGVVISDETGTTFDSTNDGIPADVSNRYQIFIVSDEKLFGGDLATGNTMSPETRPTEVDPETGINRE